MNVSSIAALTLLLTFLGVLATLIAPRLGRRARLFSNIERVESAIPDSPAKGIRVEVYHNNQKVDSPLAVASILIENTGSRDITKGEFVTPIEVEFRSPAEPMTLEIEAPTGAYATHRIEGRKAFIDWAILKPREKIRLRVAFTYDDSKIDIQEENEYLRVIARLKDVETGAGMRKFAPLFAGVIIGIFISLILLGTAVLQQLDGDRNTFIVTARDANHGKVLAGRSTLSVWGPRYQVCEPRKLPFEIASCDPIIAELYKKYFKDSIATSYFVGVRRSELILAFIMFAFYTPIGSIIYMRRRPRWPKGLHAFYNRPRR